MLTKIKQKHEKKQQNERAEPGNKFNLCKLNWQIIGPEAGSQGRKSWGRKGPAMAIT